MKKCDAPALPQKRERRIAGNDARETGRRAPIPVPGPREPCVARLAVQELQQNRHPIPMDWRPALNRAARLAIPTYQPVQRRITLYRTKSLKTHEI